MRCEVTITGRRSVQDEKERTKYRTLRHSIEKLEHRRYRAINNVERTIEKKILSRKEQ
jgi:hypothetical protein